MKTNKDLPYTETDSTINHNGVTYQVNDILNIASKKPIEFKDIKKLHWQANIDHSALDPKRVDKADTNIPIIVTVLSARRWVTLDGAHRLQKAYRNHIAVLPMIFITKEELDSLIKD